MLNNFKYFLRIKIGVYSSILILIFNLLIIDEIYSQSKFSSIAYGSNLEINHLKDLSLQNFFQNYGTSFDEKTKKSILLNRGGDFFSFEKLFEVELNGVKFISIKATLIDEKHIVKNSSVIDFSDYEQIIKKNEFTEKLIKDLFGDIIANLKFNDVFYYDFSIDKKSINLEEGRVNLVLKSDIYFNPSFISFMESVIIVLNNIKLTEESVEFSFSNNIQLYPSILLTNKESFIGYFSNSILQQEIINLINKINLLLINHKIYDENGLNLFPKSYTNYPTEIFLSYERNKWENFSFQYSKNLNLVVGSNYLKGDFLDNDSLIASFSSQILKNNFCLNSSRFSDYNNLTIKGDKEFFLLFPINIFTTRCIDENIPFITYFYELIVPTKNFNTFNLNFSVVSQ